jgi:hypothetical protein
LDACRFGNLGRETAPNFFSKFLKVLTYDPRPLLRQELQALKRQELQKLKRQELQDNKLDLLIVVTVKVEETCKRSYYFSINRVLCTIKYIKERCSKRKCFDV